MLTSNQAFSLISFGQDEAPGDLYAQAEKVYLESIGSTARTSTNEIAYWKDRYDRQFAKSGDRLYVYGLLNNSDVVGFALVFYFARHCLAVVDHIAIKAPSRHFGAFFYFKAMIAQHLLDQGHQIDFVLAEIVTSEDGDPHPVKPSLLIQLLKQSGFKAAQLRYYTPSIREDEYNQRIPAALLLYRNERTNRIRSAKLLSLIDCLLNDLYLRWYTPHSLDLGGFKRQLSSLRSEYEKQLSAQPYVILNGDWTNGGATIASEIAVKRELSPLLKASALFILVVIAATVLSGVSSIFGLNATSIALIFGTSLFAMLALLGIWHATAAEQAEKTLSFLLVLVRGQRDVRRIASKKR